MLPMVDVDGVRPKKPLMESGMRGDRNYGDWIEHYSTKMRHHLEHVIL